MAFYQKRNYKSCPYTELLSIFHLTRQGSKYICWVLLHIINLRNLTKSQLARYQIGTRLILRHRPIYHAIKGTSSRCSALPCNEVSFDTIASSTFASSSVSTPPPSPYSILYKLSGGRIIGRCCNSLSDTSEVLPSSEGLDNEAKGCGRLQLCRWNKQKGSHEYMSISKPKVISISGLKILEQFLKSALQFFSSSRL